MSAWNEMRLISRANLSSAAAEIRSFGGYAALGGRCDRICALVRLSANCAIDDHAMLA